MAKKHYGSMYRAWVTSSVSGLIHLGIRPGIVFVNDKEMADVIAEHLRANLRQVRPSMISVVSADVPKGERSELAQGLRDGSGPWVVVATQVWATGVDIPPVRWIVIDPGIGTAVPTVQSAGRASRLLSGKGEYTILVPPGKAAQRQLRSLSEAGYDAQGPYTNVDADIEEVCAEYEQSFKAGAKARGRVQGGAQTGGWGDSGAEDCCSGKNAEWVEDPDVDWSKIIALVLATFIALMLNS